ncbi:MAG TPA: nucleoside hydrolase, partial [Terriglobia bacterium]|nr:nucleoside hydrolase [Terriglobia bacterium]
RVYNFWECPSRWNGSHDARSDRFPRNRQIACDSGIPVGVRPNQARRNDRSIRPREAHEALRKALQEEPLAIVALGPLTNVALALKDRPQRQANVTRLVTVMGRRKGHVFHPVEGGTAHSFLGHGPIFRDFNLTEDEQAAAVVLAMGLPLTLIPYEAARYIIKNNKYRSLQF